MHSNKDALRKTMLGKRQAVTSQEAGVAGIRIWQQIESQILAAILPGHQTDRSSEDILCISLYCSDSTEPDFSEIIRPESTDNVDDVSIPYQIALPTVCGQQLIFRAYDPKIPLCRGSLGILEPSDSLREISPVEMDVVLVPGVAFDIHGHRLGRGKGYYDRYFNSIPPDSRPLLVGVCHDFQLIDYVPTQSGDFPMDIVVTPDRFIDISGRFDR
ncbi:MAG: 5-formyltetrahydrofolate cyclo-ligase [Clostridiaceae bacterium]|nr:5-formyltetrahydrofolate cyclo-ligase [Clostridiaceae bacterium]